MWLHYKNTAMEENFWIATLWNKKELPLDLEWYKTGICKAHQVFPIYALIDQSKKEVEHLVCALYDDWLCRINTRVSPKWEIMSCSNKGVTLSTKPFYEK